MCCVHAYIDGCHSVALYYEITWVVVVRCVVVCGIVVRIFVLYVISYCTSCDVMYCVI